MHSDLEDEFARHSAAAGRPRSCKFADILLFWLAVWATGSQRAAERELSDPKTWERLRRTVAAAYPDDESRRLSETPPSRDQYSRWRNRIADLASFGDLLTKIDAISVCIAIAIELFKTDGNFSRPPSSSCIIGDGTWIPARYKALAEDAIDRSTGEKLLLHDPDALQFTRDSQARHFRNAGHLAVICEARAPHKGERVPLSIRLHDPSHGSPANECGLAVDMALDLIGMIDGRGGKVAAFVYDMAMHQKERDTLLDRGVIPVGKVQRTKGGRYAYRHLGKHIFTLTDGTKTELDIEAIDGTPAAVCYDNKGNKQCVALRPGTDFRYRRENRTVVYGRRIIPDAPGVPERFRKARVTIQFNSTRDEIKSGQRRTRALSVLPESDPAGRELLGLRQDVESLNADLKARLPSRRARTTGRNRVTFELAGYQLFTGIRALAYYMRRNKREQFDEWFGCHKLPPNT